MALHRRPEFGLPVSIEKPNDAFARRCFPQRTPTCAKEDGAQSRTLPRVSQISRSDVAAQRSASNPHRLLDGSRELGYVVALREAVDRRCGVPSAVGGESRTRFRLAETFGSGVDPLIALRALRIR